ncbi:MAG: sulfotransferase family protein [Nocardioides sp.]
MADHFLVVGAQRCGTTYLHDLLAAHPEIAMARPARPEPKVFLRDEPVDADAYRAEFFGHAGDARLLGEKSTSYLEVPGVPERVADTLGSPRIVAQLRDPIARAVSNWSFSRDHGVEDRPLVEALRADLASPRVWDPSSSSVSPYAYVARGRYVDDLLRWAGRFDVHVQFLEELIDDRDTIGDLYAWLGVDATVRPDVGAAPVNASSTETGELDDDLVAELRDHYRDSDAALAELLGRALPWRGES